MSDQAWQSRIVGNAIVPVAEILANPKNAREHGDQQKETMRGILDEVGIVAPVIVNQRTGLLVNGHMRIALAAERGVTEWPVVYVDLSEEEEVLVLATLDPVGTLVNFENKVATELLAGMAVESDAVRLLLTGVAQQAKIRQPGDLLRENRFDLPFTYLSFKRYVVPLSEEEHDDLKRLLQHHVDETGVRFGFVNRLVTNANA